MLEFCQNPRQEHADRINKHEVQKVKTFCQDKNEVSIQIYSLGLFLRLLLCDTDDPFYGNTV